MADVAHEVRDCATSLDCAMHFEQYDRWLAARDREVAANALRDAAANATFRGVPGLASADAPSEREAVVQGWLRERADRIELQASEKGASDGEQ